MNQLLAFLDVKVSKDYCNDFFCVLSQENPEIIFFDLFAKPLVKFRLMDFNNIEEQDLRKIKELESSND